MTRSAVTTGRVRVLVCVFLNRISFPSFFDSTHLFLTLTTTAKTSRRPEMSVFLAASLKSLNKQEYQQSASPRCLCERRHTGLFVLGPDRKLLFRDTVARSFFFFSPLLVLHGEDASKDFTHSFAGVCDVHLATVCVCKRKGERGQRCYITLSRCHITHQQQQQQQRCT